MVNPWRTLVAVLIVSLTSSAARAWDHPGHMTTAAIAFSEIERARPDLIEKIGGILLKHPDPAPFWVAREDAGGKERTRRMFVEASRWPDDARWTIQDRPTWHSVRWAIVADDAPPEARALVESRGGKPMGNALEALALHAGMLTNPESKPEERALALSWLIHVLGDIHQPLHVSDFFSKAYPAGNPAGGMGFVQDPLADSAIQLHLLWDSNTRRSVKLEDVDEDAREIMQAFPRSSLPELRPYDGPADFEKWARESHQVAVDWAFDIKTIPDPEPDANKVVQKMIRYILDGVSPVEGAPKVPADYWAKLQQVVPRRMALAGYRIADIILSAADRIEVERSLSGKILDASRQ